MVPVSARRLAYEALIRVDADGAYANLVTPALLDRQDLDERDRRFVTELVHGTTRYRRAMDVLIDQHVDRSPPASIRSLLRLGAYQLVIAGVPAHAAVSETVGLAPHPQRGFVNAVLRRIATTPPSWSSFAEEASYPDWIVERLVADLGKDVAERSLLAMNRPLPAVVRPDGYAQDVTSQWVAESVGARPGELVVDMCAAPGGKATGMAACGARVVAADLRANRAGLIVDNARRTGAEVAVICADGRHLPLRTGTVDAVLLDAPCSGLGALRRRPDARWRISADDVSSLAVLQGELLEAAARLLRPGGRLIYSVCTLTAEESTDHSLPAGLVIDPAPPPGEWEPVAGAWRALPDTGDGMMMIRLRRRD